MKSLLNYLLKNLFKIEFKIKCITVLSSRLVAGTVCAGFMAAGFCLANANALSQTVSSAKTPLHMPQGAFLRVPSPDVAHLVQQVKSDPAVAIRYSRLFHLPVKMVPLAFEQLHLKKMAADHIMQVHFVKSGESSEISSPSIASSKSSSSMETNSMETKKHTNSKGLKKVSGTEKEELVFKMRRVRAGTLVYCLPDGTPLLVRVCGNPIRARMSPEFYNTAPVPNFNPRERLVPKPAAINSLTIHANMPQVSLLTAMPLPIITSVPATDVLSATLIPAAPALPPAELRTASLPPVYTWAHSPSGFWGAPPALGLLSLFDSGRHGSSGPVLPGGSLPIVPPPSTPETPSIPIVPIVSITPISPPFASVPEPGIMGVSLLTLLGVSYVRFRKRG